MFVRTRPRALSVAVAATAVLATGSLAVAGSANAASVGSTTTTTGQTFQVSITTPADGASLPAGTTSAPVGGTIAIGPQPASGTAHVAFLIDQSTSLGATNFGTEKQGAIDLFNQIRSTPGLTVDTSLTFFATTVTTVLPDQPAADNFVTAVTNQAYSGGTTHTKDAISAVLSDLSGKSGTKQVVLITDGTPNPSNQTPTAAQRTALDQAGIAVYTYAVGPDATCTPLQTISTQCTEVADFSSLSSTLTGTPPAGVQGVDISVDNGALVPVTSLTSTGQISATAANLHVGDNTIVLRGTATDGTVVTASVVAHVPATGSTGGSTGSGGSAGGTTGGTAAPIAIAGHGASSCRVSIRTGKRHGTVAIRWTRLVAGGSLQARLHKLHTPTKATIKIALVSKRGSITKRLSKGTWHGTVVYQPASGSGFTPCGRVFYHVKVR